ncbi:hypothetical protein EC32608_2127 [Escherichia coli 3.2608]|nr:hypothetical protein ECAA86_01070 [Escherichia coli AA86]EHW72723.1 hypothetical protein ECDEC10B_1852 [Escherichia coli DEC10B]EHW96279.1 hypothetical protein ECDEC11A_0933 [Escherichia coli DEC11A]EIG83403.1 hypothetical protein EC12741_4566 [Escherichia coli 1.2741]EIH57199.1 hypothetical protein EC32608_2127 [Escherichia coli 3.2608]EIH68447.1 hypothetical protein EC930624_1690 [Escherichia coli 93.0624]ENC41614.1 hypothetical protein ECP029991710_1217 [Escherichia coli P0299917.10]EN
MNAGTRFATLLNESLISGICSTSATHRLKSAASWGAPK